MCKDGHFLEGTGTSRYFGDLEKNSLKCVGIARGSDGKSLALLPGLKRHLKVQSEISYEKFQQSRLKELHGQLLFLLYLYKQAKFFETKLVLQTN